MIEVRSLTKSYPGSARPVLEDVEFSVPAGAVMWVCGPSGSGKSTLLNVLGLLTRADSGSCMINGVEMLGAAHQVRSRGRRELVSTIFQRGNLFAHLSVLENVMVGMSAGSVADANEHLAAVGMADLAHRRAGLLSGGEQGRVAIARAAARRTPVLLADEPVAALDDANAEIVMALLSEAALRGVAVVVVSHDARAAQIATERLALPRRPVC